MIKNLKPFVTACLTLLVVPLAIAMIHSARRVPELTGQSGYRAQKSSGTFQRTLSGDFFQITTTFNSYRDRGVTVTYPVNRREYERLTAGFGLDKNSINAEIIRIMNQSLNRAITEKGFTMTVSVRPNEKGGVSWNYRYRFADQAEKERILAFAATIKTYYTAAAEYAYSRAGFIMQNNMVYPDFASLAETHRGAVTGVHDALENFSANRAYSRRDAAGLVLAYCQTIPYVTVPLQEDNRLIGGLYPPVKTVTENRGDCDCKAILFATIWQIKRPGSTLLIHIPGHMFAAVEGNKEFSTDLAISYKGRTYLFIEPVGPALYPIGRVAPASLNAVRAHDFRIIEPYRRSFAASGQGRWE